MVRTVGVLRRSGDHVKRMEGVLSGTLTFLFDELNRGRPFSEAVADAKARGISEPDPRDDLGLKDVVRKLVILARTAGFELEPDQVSVEPILPEELLRAPSVDDFMKLLPQLDEDFARRTRVAKNNGRRLACIGTIEPNGASVSLREVPLDRPAARIKGTENVLEIWSDRYSEYPILIQGPGAGQKVTAAGLITDLVAAAGRVTHGLRRPVDEL
jgi:aspartokinase/homoserine dehydrogenase 1